MEKKKKNIDFEAIYPGFHKYSFALYNDETIWFEDKEIPQQGFFGNTAKEEEKFNRKIHDYAGILKEGRYLFDVRKNGFFSRTMIRLLERECKERQSEIQNKLEKEQASKQQKIGTFFSDDTEYHEAVGFICGYDPMNQIRFGDKLWVKHFMAINVNGEIIQMHEECVVEMQENSSNLTKGYWKRK